MTNISAQNVKTVSQKIKPFWEFALRAISEVRYPYFSVKICYNATELTTPQLAARFFPFELEQASYFELVDFSFNSLFPGERRLYRLPFRSLSEWQNDFPFFPNANGGTYLIPLTELELLHNQLDTDPIPFKPVEVFTPEPTAEEAMPLPAVEDVPSAYDDAHLNTLTARDKFCLDHAVPFSNTSWINQMINEANNYQAEQAVKIALQIQTAQLSR